MSADYSYGIQYTPATVAQAVAKPRMQDLRTYGVQFVRLHWVDFTNHIRYRVIPIAHFEKMLKSPRPSICLTKSSFGLVFISLAPGFSATGEYLYVPDLDSLRFCPYSPGHASVMGWFQEKVPMHGPNGPSVEVDLCPRTILRRSVERAKATSGIEFLVGFETEFILLKNTDPVEAVNDYGWSVSAALSTNAVETKVLEEIALALLNSSVELQMYHAEAAPGQYEVVTGPLPPLQAVDALIHTRETITNIAAKYGLRATLAPRVYMDNCGSAAHCHISVHSAMPSPPSSTPNLTAHEASFLSGLLEHLPAVTLLTLPTPASYKRVVDGVWSGGTHICWGTDNREAPVRLCNASAPRARNFELKTLDGTANPYLALAGVLGAGAAGVRASRPLRIQDCAGELSAAELGEEGRHKLGITQRMPLNVEQARERFAADALMAEIFGRDFVRKYLDVNTLLGQELTQFKTETEELTLLVRTY